MSRVKIGKTVEYKALEVALIKAAEEMGWKAKVKDEYHKEYELGSVKKTQKYSSTTVNLKGKIFSAMKIIMYGKEPTSDFHVWAGFPFGSASEKKVQQYLSAVSENLK